MKLNYLKIQNFASHIDSYVDLTKFSSALVIGVINNNDQSSNGAGKSSLVGAIRWCLFEKSIYRTVEDVIRHNAKFVKVELGFEEGGQNYVIIRERNKTGSHDVSLLRDKKDISGSTVRDTNSRIVSILKFDDDVFVNSVFLQQNDIARFASATPAERKELIKAILNITKWDFYEALAKKKSKAASKKLEDYDGKYDKEELIKSIKDNSKAIVEKRVLKDKTKIVLSRIKKNLAKAGVSDIDDKKKQLEDLNSQLKIEKISEKEYSDSILREEKRKVEIENEIKANDKIADPEALNFTKEDIKNGKKQLEEWRSEIAVLSSDFRKISIMKEGAECYACESIISKEKADEFQDKIKIAEEEIEKIGDKYEQLRITTSFRTETMKCYEQEVIVYAQAQKDLIKGKELLEEIEDRIKKENDRLNGIKINIENLNSEISSINIDPEDKTIAEDRKRLNDLEARVDGLSIDIGIATEKRNASVKKYKEYLKDVNKIEDLRKDAVLYDQLRKVFGKKGIQTVLLSKVIRELEARANEMLKLLCESDKQIVISIDMQRQKADGSVTETFDINAIIGSRISNFEGLSGGEKVRVAFAMRISLSQILAARKGGNVGVIFLDEVDGSLDPVGVTSYVKVIKFLEKKFKILVVTHKDDIKDSFLNKILVKNDFGISRVYQNES